MRKSDNELEKWDKNLYLQFMKKIKIKKSKQTTLIVDKKMQSNVRLLRTCYMTKNGSIRGAKLYFFYPGHALNWNPAVFFKTIFTSSFNFLVL